jgi:hypothetical protein
MVTLGNMGASQRAALCLPLAPHRSLVECACQSPVGAIRNSTTSGRPRRWFESFSAFLRSRLLIVIRY